MEAPEEGDKSTLPQLTPKTAGGSQRVIKQIMVIDPNKLRLAGLDVKMAEALKKAKKKNQPKSKESKLAAAKSILNKKLKEALSKKGSPNVTLNPTPSKSVLPTEEASKKLPPSEKDKAVKTKPKISVATLKSLMPPPSFPVSSLISSNQTVEIKVLKSEKTKQSIEVKIVDSLGETQQKIDTFPKASLKTESTSKTVKTQNLTPEIKLDTNNSSLSEDRSKPGISTQASGEISQNLVHAEDKKKKQNSIKGSLKEKDTSRSVHSKSISNTVETSKNKSPNIVHGESPSKEKPLNEKTSPIENQSESLVAEAGSLIEMASLMPIHTDSLPKASEPSFKIINSMATRRESLPKVIESKVLSPGEKIDLSILTKKSPSALTVPKKRYKLDQNWITSESNRDESVYINLSPIPKPSPPKAVEQESAVDFINNLSVFFAESQKNKSQTKNASEILTEECGEDATSFLVSLFQKKQDTSTKTSTPIKKNEGSKATAVTDHCTTEDVHIERKIKDTGSETPSKTINPQVADLDINNSPNRENKSNKDLQVEDSLHESTVDNSQTSAKLRSEETSIQDSKSIISNSEKDPKSIELKKPTEPSSELAKTTSHSNLSIEANRVLPDESISMTSESLQEPVSKPSTPPVSSRRKASKPTPVLIPKLRKSRKPANIAQKPPEDKTPQKCTEKPVEESPTQPVQNMEEFKASVSSDSTPCQTEVQKKELPDKSTKSSTQITDRKRRDTPTYNEESPASSTASSSKVSSQILDEVPTTSKVERPQRQRKISLKLIESSEFQGVIDKTVEQLIKQNKESTSATERPQRQRKVSFKLLDSSESLPTTAKPSFQALANSNVQDIKGNLELSSTTERPQRQRRITLKLLDSSESLSTMKPLVQVKNRSNEQEITEKVELAIEKEKPQCTQRKTEDTNLDSLIAIEMKNQAIKDPIAQLVAFHETVEKFELSCGTVNSKNTTTNLEGECSSLSEYPFYDAICSKMPAENVQTNLPTEGKENVSSDQTSTKTLRKRKDSLKSRTFAGEQISIVSSDSLSKPDQTIKNIQNSSSVKQTRKRKETPTMRQTESEEVAEDFDLTPKRTERKSHARNLESEIVQSDEKPSSESKEMVDNSTVVENFNVPQSTKTETPSNVNVKKRRGRPPKVKKEFTKSGVIGKAAEVAQKSTENITDTISKNDNLGGSWETITSTDEHHSQEITQVKVVEKGDEFAPQTTESSSIEAKSTTPKKSGETLPSADKLSQEVTIFGKSGSKITKKTKNKTTNNEDKKDDAIDDDIVEEAPVLEKENETAKVTKRRQNSIEDKREVAKDNEIHRRGSPSKVSNISEKLAKESIDLNEIPNDAQNQEEMPSTSESMKIFDNLSECKEGTNMIDAIQDINPTKNTPDKQELLEGTKKFVETSTPYLCTIKISQSFSDADKTSDKNPLDSSQDQSSIDKKQTLSKDGSNDYIKLIKTSIDIGTSVGELSNVDAESGKQINPEDGLFHELKSLTKENESKYHRDVQVDEREVIPETSEPDSLDPSKSSKIMPSDSLGPCQVMSQVSEFDHVKLTDRSLDTTALNAVFSAAQTDKSNISDKQAISKNVLFEELKSPNPESKFNESKPCTDLPKTKEPTKIVPQFDDLMFDLDHIESPSFSPICESSRISNDSDRFEEFDEDFTSAIIHTVTEAEIYAEQTLEKSLNSSDFVGESKNNSKSAEEPKVCSLVDQKTDNLKQILSQSPGNPEPLEGPKSDSVKESPALKSSFFVTEDPISGKDEPSSTLCSFDLSKKSSDNFNPLEGKISSSNSSILGKKFSDETKQIEKPSEVISEENSPMPFKSSDKIKESPLLISTVLEKNVQENSKQLNEQKSHIASPNTELNSSALIQKSPNYPTTTVEETPEKIEQSSALHSAVVNKSEPKKKNAKNPFKIQKPKKHEEESANKPHIDFLGFNEKEIEEGQQSTSLRLSQSEDAECFNIESPLTSKIKQKHNIKESQSISGKKQKLDKEKWEKNSAKSLKNWLSNPKTSASNDDVCDIKEDTKEQSSSVPLKKRRGKVQNLIEPVPLEKVVDHLETKINAHDTSIKQVDESLIEESSNSSSKKEKPKRGRKPKLKNVEKIEDISSSKEDINSSSKSFSKNNSLLIDAEASKDEKPKRNRKLKLTNNEEFKTPTSEKKTKVGDRAVIIKKEPSEKISTPVKGRANKRKRSVSEENASATITEPPTKVAHVDSDLNSSDSSIRKARRSRKITVHDTPNVPVVQNSPVRKKYKDDYEFNPRLLLIRTKEELKSNEPLIDPNLQTEPKGPDDVQCALCMGYASKKKWIQHVSTHYGIGWIVGRQPPLNINSRGSILSYLIEFYKVSKVKGLNCRLCKSLRRSALGLLMHLEQCCLTEAEINDTRVVCEYCKKNYTKSSYLVHKRTCAEYLKQILKEAKAETLEIPEGPTPDDVLSNTGRLKRKAVIMAETKLKKLDETPEFVPDDLIKHIPSKNIRSIESIKENWHMEINSFGKGFCASKTCRFTAIAIDDLIDHYQEKVCPYYEKAGYFCVRCKFYNQNIEAVRSHVIDRHSPKPPRGKGDLDAEIDSSESSDSISSGEDEGESESGSVEVDENGERKPKRKKKPKLKARRRTFQCKNPPTKDYRKLLPERCSNIHNVVARFYDQFIETNYSLDPLFKFAKTNVTYIEASESYFPKSADSMKFICNGFHGFVKNLGESKVQPDQWKQLERLHGITENGEYTIYMGGPVKYIAWVPLDPHPPTNTQYLAVTVRKGLDKFTRFLNQKRSRSLIFILKFDISMPSEIKAEISYAIAIDEGPIHAIEFLPSGGYSPEMNRLGMLAVGTIETEIKIYSLPLKVDKLDCDFFPIVRLEASIELHLELLNNPSDKTDMYSSQCTCLVWSQTAGHNIIVGSFLNGFVGIWDISDDAANLNRFEINESRKFTPISYFWTSEDRLMNLGLHYDMNGPRWLAASNSTRKMMLYDLRDITQPMLLRVEVTINIINCIEWPVAWENVLFGLGDAMPSNGCVISAFSPMSIMFATRRFEKFCSGVTDINFNIWRNCFAAGADNGDVQVTPLREAVLDVSQRLKTDEKTISTLDIVPLNGENISRNGIQTPSDGMRVFDKDHKDQYGIVFGSIRKIKGCNKPDYYNTHRVPPLNLQRLMRVSKIRFNQNKNACDVLAIGYDNGLLRISIHDWLKKG